MTTLGGNNHEGKTPQCIGRTKNRSVPIGKKAAVRVQRALQCNYFGDMPIDSEGTSSESEELNQKAPTGSGFEPFRHYSSSNPDVEREENTDKPSTDSLTMNFIIWNTRETNNACFRRHCNAFVSIHKPAMMALLETKMTNHTKITQDLGFGSQTQSSAKGLSGGIVIMWKEDNIKLDNFLVNSQGIHAMVKANTNPYSWLFSALYTSIYYRR
ncbi:hypothetical protein KY285_000748 [Solanum tuberosum]|nr:hypothetical protein KY285_000748 [Solanum tuberosum]